MILLQNIWVKIQEKEVVKGFSLRLQEKEIAVLLGPNGSGKSSLALAIAGHPDYHIPRKKGTRLEIDNKNILSLSPEERAKAGLFVSFQNPVEIEGLRVEKFLREAYFALQGKEERSLKEELEFLERLEKIVKEVGLTEEFLDRSVNFQFSGGEKKRFELLQLRILEPRFAILDEIDTGLDIDGLEIFRKVLKELKRKGTSFLLITHNPKSLRYILPDKVIILKEGRVVKEGGKELISLVEKKGFEGV